MLLSDTPTGSYHTCRAIAPSTKIEAVWNSVKFHILSYQNYALALINCCSMNLEQGHWCCI